MLMGWVGKVIKIGIRASLIETVDNVTVIVPNSKLTTENVINWSHYDRKVRFSIEVGVAYGSDTRLVEKLLLQAAADHPYAVRHPSPFIRFMAFGESSLDFKLYFWSYSLFEIESIKSDMRFKIDNLFKENGIVIPFPQRDVWHKVPSRANPSKDLNVDLTSEK